MAMIAICSDTFVSMENLTQIVWIISLMNIMAGLRKTVVVAENKTLKYESQIDTTNLWFVHNDAFYHD